VLIPKCEGADYIKKAEEVINSINKKFNLKNQVFLMPIIESALGIENSWEIAHASESVVALAIGLEDYTADLGVTRTIEGNESFYARTRLIVAAKAAGIQPIDSVFSDVADMDALLQNVLISKSLGFEGMGCIHPRQIAVIKKGFTPDQAEIEKSKKIVQAFESAKIQGLGVVALGSKMIDPPVVARAQKIIDLAVRLNLISGDWINEITSVEK
jgi:citrate lyase subunit beta/citryl-CoA lyase